MKLSTIKSQLISHSYLLARSVYMYSRIQRITLCSFAMLLEIFLPVSAVSNAVYLSETTGQLIILICATPPVFYFGYLCNLLVQSLVLHMVYRYPRVERMIQDLAKRNGVKSNNTLWYRESIKVIRQVRHKSFWI